MSNSSEHDAEQLSALADGELDPATVGQVCGRWRAGTTSHATWHAYHVIGDVLRSEDLASDAKRDHEAFAKLRARLACEPMISAAASAPERSRTGWAEDSSRRNARRWGAAFAVAAGFATVAGVLFVLRVAPGGASEQGVNLARTGTAASPAMSVDAKSQTAGREAQARFADGRLVRDPSLDRYLDAHKDFSGSSALGVPSSFLRAATSDASGR
jgi:sigma-E factor negative regulatory protein RseA